MDRRIHDLIKAFCEESRERKTDAIERGLMLAVRRRARPEQLEQLWQKMKMFESADEVRFLVEDLSAEEVGLFHDFMVMLRTPLNQWDATARDAFCEQLKLFSGMPEYAAAMESFRGILSPISDE